MQIYESGGMLMVKSRPHWRRTIAALALAGLMAWLPPLLGAYLLIVA